MRLGLASALGLALTLAAGVARAEPVLTRKVALDRVGLDFGWDPIWVLGVAYSRGWPGVLRGHDGRLGLRYEAPVSLWLGGGAWRLMASGTALVLPHRSLGIATSIDTGVVRARDVTGDRTGWSLELGAQPGVFAGGGPRASTCAGGRCRWSRCIPPRWWPRPSTIATPRAPAAGRAGRGTACSRSPRARSCSGR